MSGAMLDWSSGLLVQQTEPEAYVATLAVGNVVLRVFLYSTVAHRAGLLAGIRNDPFESYLLPLWPVGPAVTWPRPGSVLDGEGLMRLMETVPSGMKVS